MTDEYGVRGRPQRRHHAGHAWCSQNELIQLIQYTPTTAQVYKRPLVIVPPCINKYYILDLQPANSFVAHAVAEGHTVFLVSWRNVGAEQGTLTWDDYLEQGVLAGDRRGAGDHRADKANTLGFCVGGTLLASALAVRGRPRRAHRGEHDAADVDAGLHATPARSGCWSPTRACWPREAAIGQGGVLKGSELAQVFASLRANDLIWPYVVKGYLKGKAPPAFDLLYWNSDGTNLPGPMFCWYLRNTYLENKLREPGATTQLRRAGGPGDDRRADVRLRLEGRPHRAVEDGLREHAAARRRRHLRARRQRPHRRGDQPAGEEQAQLLDGRALDADPERWFDGRGEGPRQLVAGVVRVAGAARAVRKVNARKTPGNAEFTADRARPGQLREGEGRVAPGTAGSTPPG